MSSYSALKPGYINKQTHIYKKWSWKLSISILSDCYRTAFSSIYLEQQEDVHALIKSFFKFIYKCLLKSKHKPICATIFNLPENVPPQENLER